MSDDDNYTWRTYLLAGIAILALAAGMVAAVGNVKADGAEAIRSKCADLWFHADEMANPDQVKADCRDRGWQVNRRFVASPDHRRMWVGLEPCRFDEAEGPSCYWNAKRQGNGYGRSFVYFKRLGVFYVHRINGRAA